MIGYAIASPILVRLDTDAGGHGTCDFDSSVVPIGHFPGDDVVF